jgi:hypothetical protein
MKFGKLVIEMEDGTSHKFAQQKNGDIRRGLSWEEQARQLFQRGSMYNTSDWTRGIVDTTSTTATVTTSGRYQVQVRSTVEPIYVTDEPRYFTDDDDIPF